MFSERLLQVLVRSSIVETVFPKDPQAQEVNLLPFEDRHTFTRKGQIILQPKRRWQSQNFLSDRENQIFIRLFNNIVESFLFSILVLILLISNFVSGYEPISIFSIYTLSIYYLKISKCFVIFCSNLQYFFNWAFHFVLNIQ